MNTVASLPAKWREENGDYPESKKDCADELEAALATPAVEGGLPELPATRFWADSMVLDQPGCLSEHPAEIFLTLRCAHTVQFDQPLYTADQMRAYGEQCRLATPEQPIDWRRLAAHITDAMKAEGWGVPSEEEELRADVEAAVQNGLNAIGVEARTEQPGSAVQGEAVAWHTEDHLYDRSATTYDPAIAERWRNKGWPVVAMSYTTPPPAPAAEQVKPEARGVEGIDFLSDALRMTGYMTDDQCREVASKLLHFVVDLKQAAAPNPVRAEQPEGKVAWLRDIVGELRVAQAYAPNPSPCEKQIKKVLAMLASAPAAPGAGVGVDEAMVERALSAPFDGYRVNSFIPLKSPDNIRRLMRAALTAAIAGKDGA